MGEGILFSSRLKVTKKRFFQMRGTNLVKTWNMMGTFYLKGTEVTAASQNGGESDGRDGDGAFFKRASGLAMKRISKDR